MRVTTTCDETSRKLKASTSSQQLSTKPYHQRMYSSLFLRASFAAAILSVMAVTTGNTQACPECTRSDPLEAIFDGSVLLTDLLSSEVSVRK